MGEFRSIGSYEQRSGRPTFIEHAKSRNLSAPSDRTQLKDQPLHLPRPSRNKSHSHIRLELDEPLPDRSPHSVTHRNIHIRRQIPPLSPLIPHPRLYVRQDVQNVWKLVKLVVPDR